MTKHTPGPWRVSAIDGGIDQHDIVGPNGEDIGYANPSDGMDEATEYPVNENARLMAAAPDLLIACKAALNDRMYKDWPGIADLLIAAIAKAEGA